jgi:hypothetical protein
MTWPHSLEPLAVTALLCGAIASPLLGAPGAPPATPTPIATEQLGGTILSLTPQTEYERATLRVSGPDGYALTKRFAATTTITADLLLEAETPEGAPTRERTILADGRYRYEVVFDAGEEESWVHTGMFLVEGGAAVAHGTRQTDLEATRRTPSAVTTDPGVARGGTATYVDDALYIDDAVGDHKVELSLRSSFADWTIRSEFRDLLIRNPGFTTPRIFLDGDGQVGIGTYTPLEDLHIVSDDGADIRLSGLGGDWILRTGPSRSGTPQFALHDATTDNSPILVTQGAPHASLVIREDGGVSLGSRTVPAALEIHGHVRGTTFRSASSRELKTGFRAADAGEIVEKLSLLPVTWWRYLGEGEDDIHLGPVAEDFQRLFGLGDGETIANVDAVGVLMAAVQGLHRRLEERDRLVARLTARVAALEARPADAPALLGAPTPWIDPGDLP